MTKGLNPYIGDILETGFTAAQVVVVILSGDDEACLRKEFIRRHDPADERIPRPQPRPNVLFEAGMAMGKRPDVTILVQVGEIRGISDIAGRHLIRMDNSSQARAELANALKKAGCDIDLNKGRRWRKAGDFQNTNSDRSPSS